jgi:hypothetical protein
VKRDVVDDNGGEDCDEKCDIDAGGDTTDEDPTNVGGDAGMYAVYEV